MSTQEKTWHFVCEKNQIPLNEGRKVNYGDYQVALFKTKTGFYAIDNACPHKQGPLADGIVAGNAVFCPLHNLKIDLISGCSLADVDGSVRCYSVKEEDNNVFICFDKF